MISKAQARQAFYKAAENIERNPELYDVFEVQVGEPDTPTCLWGHAARAAGLSSVLSTVCHVPRAFGFADQECLLAGMAARFPNPMCAKEAPFRLRAFADKHFPESEEKFQPCGQSFQELIDSLNGIAA